MIEDHLSGETPNNPATPDPADDELWDAQKVLEYFGGTTKPIHISTLYRGIIGKVYPPPINVSPNVVRWLPRECREARQRMIAARDLPKPKPVKPRGRKRGASVAKTKAEASA
jgi:predicted DNA-binding transcriptional regulator AlpA